MGKHKAHLDEIVKDLNFSDTDSFQEEVTEEQSIMTAILNGEEDGVRERLGDDAVDKYLQRRGMAHIHRR